YPDNRGEPLLRRAIASKLQRENGVVYDPDCEILVTDGATLGIFVAVMALLNEGDAVMLPDPIYDAYQSPVRLAGGYVRSVQSALVGGRFELTRDALEQAWTPQAKLLLLNTPWNPVGTVFRHAELVTIADFVRERGLLLLSDEIYEHITYGDHKHISPAILLRDRTVLVNSLSKTYAMTGWRVGYCAAPEPLISAMLLILQQSSRGPATFVQDAAVAALDGPQDAIESMRRTYAERRMLVLDRLGGIDGVNVLAPEGGFFAMVDVRKQGLPSNQVRQQLLKQHGVAVMHGAAYGPRGEGTLRVSFASGGKTLDEGLERLREGLAAL
ncbi:MAG: aminotransferase class I/II-fold pyridoxal phosphate-dependent enzyme, partial [Acidobacteriota bacterium]|nr:aminotransferase class I/II-fold pyridoxal phosphate-dependent enzyme [Acidobacteriota bacterium]